MCIYSEVWILSQISSWGCHTKSCPPLKLSGVGAYQIQTLYRRGVRVRVGLGFSIDETIGGQLTAGDHSRHYRAANKFHLLEFVHLSIALSLYSILKCFIIIIGYPSVACM